MTSERWAQRLQAHELLAGAQVRDRGESVEIQRGEATVVLLGCEQASEHPELISTAAARAQGILLVGAATAALQALASRDGPLALLDPSCADDTLALTVGGLLERVELRSQVAQHTKQLSRFRYERGELVEIARAITQERNIDTLLDLILEKSRYITGADAGSIYVRERAAGKDGFLRFKLSQNDSVGFESSEFVIPISTDSIAGAAVVTRQPINISDVYQLGDDVPYSLDKSFDARMGYRTVSMLTMPMISSEGHVTGVIQLINKKVDPSAKLRDPEAIQGQVIPFDQRSEELLTTLAAQASISLENALLYDEIQKIFEGFVRASVQAIEQRDPTTSGHSVRVSVLSCALAKVVDNTESGPYRGTKFSSRDLQELEYASLLHDFGKIGVREEVLVKAKKLYPHEHGAIQSRIHFAIKNAETEALTEKLSLVQGGASSADLDAVDERSSARRATLTGAWEIISKANEPTILKEGDFSKITEIAAITYLDLEGNSHPLLTEEEVISLHIMRGSLSPNEIDEIRSHVTHTFNFLSQIPWGEAMAQVPRIAHAHHEKLNGSGYPLGIGGDDIPVQSRIMTIADIYDALTARDRPYKRALARSRALEILGYEVKDGNLDADLLEIFREAQVYKASEG